MEARNSTADFEPIEGLEVMNETHFERNWKVIGSGGFGQVYKARHLQWRKDVAVKTLWRDDGLSLKEDLVRELKVMLSAESLHTVKVLGVFKGCTPFSPFVLWGLVMELMDGGSLKSLQPGVPQPDVPQPGVPQPDVPQPDVPQRDGPQPDGPQPDVLQCDFQRLTLDTNTTCRTLSLSENKRKVTDDGQDHSYPDHPDRFDYWSQVLSAESLDERCYIEVQFSGEVFIGVTSRDISRKGRGDSLLGRYEQSWVLLCRDVHHNKNYGVFHNSKVAAVPLRPDGSNRVAVYLDRPAGTLSFYRVSEDTLSHLYTYQHTFTEPLYAGFIVGSGSSLSLCEDRQAVRTDML